MDQLTPLERKRMGVLSLGLGLLGAAMSVMAGSLLWGSLMMRDLNAAVQRDLFGIVLIRGTSGLLMLTFAATVLYLCVKTARLARGAASQAASR